MTITKRIAFISIFCFVAFVSKAQTDTAFWFGAPAISSGHANSPIVLRLSSYDQPSVITISMPANPSFTPYIINLIPYSAATVDLTSRLNMVESKPENTVLNNALKVTATNNISAYYEVQGVSTGGNIYNPEIFALKGRISKGLNFLIPGQNRFANGLYNPQPHNGFVIVATEDNTTVTINPKTNAVGHIGGTAFTVLLQKGQAYTVIASSTLGAQHLVGSSVKADKPVCITIYDDSIGPDTGCRDLVGDQIIPEDANGKEFIIIKGKLNISPQNGDYFYVLGTVDATDVKVNGTLVRTINRGEVYEGILNQPSAYITTSNPAYVNQLTGIGCEMAATDLPSIRCTGSSSVSFIRSATAEFYLNILCKAADINGFLLNGKSGIISGGLFAQVPGTNGEWMYASISLSNLPGINGYILTGASTTVSNSTGLFHLGFLNGSDGTGNRLGYFSNYAQTSLSPIAAGLQCTGSNINLTSTLVSGATYLWSGPNNFSATTNTTALNNISPVNSGSYKVAANILGCGTFTDSVQVTVHPLPTVTMSNGDSICLGDSKIFKMNFTGSAPFNFSYTDGTKTDTVKLINNSNYDLVVKPVVSTTYTLKHITDSNSCTAAATATLDIVRLVKINPLPTANFSLSSVACENRAVLFTDKSVANNGFIKRWNWNFTDGTIKDTTNGDTFSKSFSLLGNYPVRLMVETNNGCKSDTIVTITKINAIPKVGFVLPEVCVSDGTASFTDTSSISDGTQAQFVWSWKIFPGTNSNIQPSFINATAQNAKVLVTKEDRYKTLLKVTSINGCVDSLFQQLTVNGPTPKANFVVQNSTNLCSNDSIRIMNTSKVDFGNITRLDIIWDAINAPAIKTADENPVDSTLYAKKFPNFPNPATQAYTVKLIAFSGATCQNTSTQIVTINRSPQPVFLKPRDICLDASARIILPQASGYAGFPVTSVYSGTGITNSATGLFDPSVAGAGTFNIKYLQTSVIGCKDSITQKITVWPSPIAKWGVSATLCENNRILFTDSSVAGFSNIMQRNWVFDDGSTLQKNNADTFSHIYTIAKTYNASLKVTTDSGCVSTLKIQALDVHYLPKIDFSLPGICLPEGSGQFISSSTIADNTDPLFSYRWNFNDPNDPTSATTINPIHKYSALGPYPVQLIIRTNNNCVDSATKILNTIYPQPKANFSVSNTEICSKTTVQFTDLSDGKTSALNSWSWDLANGDNAIIQNPSKNFIDTGSFTVKLFITNTQGCVSDTAFQQITVNPYPVLIMGKSKLVLEGGTVALTAQYIYGTQLKYQWAPAQFLNNDTARAPLSTPIDDIAYQLFLSGIGGCTVTDTLFVKVLKSPMIPNAFSPNGDGINDDWKIQYLESYPGTTVDIFNRYGQKVFSSIGYEKPWDGKYNGKVLPVGTYYYVINPKNGRAILSGSVTIIL